MAYSKIRHEQGKKCRYASHGKLTITKYIPTAPFVENTPVYSNVIYLLRPIYYAMCIPIFRLFLMLTFLLHRNK